MTRNQKAIREREPDPTFYESDAELQEADSDVIREFGHDAMPREDEYENQ